MAEKVPFQFSALVKTTAISESTNVQVAQMAASVRKVSFQLIF